MQNRPSARHAIDGSVRPQRREGRSAMRRSWATITVLLAVVALLGAATAASSAPQRPLGPDQRLDRLVDRLQATSSGRPAAATLDNFKFVGHSGLDGYGDYGDCFAHGDFAHVHLAQGTIGCHEIDAVQRADGRVLAVCARNLIDHINTGGAVAIHIVDATDPASPQAIT